MGRMGDHRRHRRGGVWLREPAREATGGLGQTAHSPATVNATRRRRRHAWCVGGDDGGVRGCGEPGRRATAGRARLYGAGVEKRRVPRRHRLGRTEWNEKRNCQGGAACSPEAWSCRLRPAARTDTDGHEAYELLFLATRLCRQCRSTRRVEHLHYTMPFLTPS